MLGLSKVKVLNSGDCMWAHPHYIQAAEGVVPLSVSF